ncbi:ferritin-like superfamily [Phlyctochytrium arcticum]|nr:ferritin-like superfamily [Phlyctochytrium arcticum]
MLTAEEPTEGTNALSFGDDSWDESDKTIEYKEEPILKENSKRFVLFPLQYREAYDTFKVFENRFWNPEDIKLSEDEDQFKKLSGKQRAGVIHAIGMLAVHYANLGGGLDSRISDECQIPEVRCVIGYQMMQRNTHTEVWHNAMAVFTKPEEQVYIFDLIKTLPSMSKKAVWMQRHVTDSDEHFCVRLYALCVWFRICHGTITTFLAHFGVLPSPGDQNRSQGPPSTPQKNNNHMSSKSHAFLPSVVHGLARINRDYRSYHEFLARISRTMLVNHPPTAVVHTMVKEAIAIELDVFADLREICGGTLSALDIEITPELLKRRLHSLGDEVLTNVGYPKLYGTTDDTTMSRNSMETSAWIEPMLDASVGKDARKEQLNATKQTQRSSNVATPMKKEEFSLEEDF